MALQKNDFIELEFTGRVKDGEIFDSNIPEDLKKLNSDAKPKPEIIGLGQGMFIKAVDDFLIGKETGKYTIELSPEKAFGQRVKEFIQMVPINVFHSQKLTPVPGAVFNFDNRIAKVLTVSGGRVVVDFNHPLAGKSVVYEVNVLRKVEDLNEKIKTFITFLFRRELKFSVNEKKLTIEAEKSMAKFIEMFREKFKEIFELDLEVKEIADKKEEKAEAKETSQ